MTDNLRTKISDPATRELLAQHDLVHIFFSNSICIHHADLEFFYQKIATCPVDSKNRGQFFDKDGSEYFFECTYVKPDDFHCVLVIIADYVNPPPLPGRRIRTLH